TSQHATGRHRAIHSRGETEERGGYPRATGVALERSGQPGGDRRRTSDRRRGGKLACSVPLLRRSRVLGKNLDGGGGVQRGRGFAADSRALAGSRAGGG